MSKTPLEQFEEDIETALIYADPFHHKKHWRKIAAKKQMTAAGKRFMIAQLGALRSQVDHNGTARSLSVKKLDEVIEQYREEKDA